MQWRNSVFINQNARKLSLVSTERNRFLSRRNKLNAAQALGFQDKWKNKCLDSKFIVRAAKEW